MTVSRNSSRKNDFDKFAKFPITEGMNREERKQPRTLLKNPPNKMKNGKTKRHLLFAWVLASVPVFIPQYLSLNFVFCEYLFEGWERELVKFRLPSVFGKGEFSDSSRFWGEGEILTLVADQGHSFSPFFCLVIFFLTGTWGLARVFSLRLRILKNG